MLDYLIGNPVVVTVPLLTSGGDVITATAAQYRIVNHDGTVVLPLTNVPDFTGAESEISVAIDALVNAETPLPGIDQSLYPPRSAETRSVQIFLTTATGTVMVEESYRLVPIDRLVVPFMSFQTYTSALAISGDLQGMDSWNAADRDSRINALMEARNHLCSLGYRFSPYEVPDWQSRVQMEFEVTNLGIYTATQFESLPYVFRELLKRAQVIEANYVLSGESTSSRRIAGLVAETIGETSQRWRGSKPMRYPVCEQAMIVLSRYIIGGRRLGRA